MDDRRPKKLQRFSKDGSGRERWFADDDTAGTVQVRPCHSYQSGAASIVYCSALAISDMPPWASIPQVFLHRHTMCVCSHMLYVMPVSIA